MESNRPSKPQIALSQYRNLLFIAYGDKIHVFKPQFPLQTLSQEPDLVVKLPKTREGLQGYIDANSAHDINHLIVGDLGNEEILVVACDDGDIISYQTLSIHSEIAYRHGNSSPLKSLRHIEPWFLENVGKSAWGLAIHKEARLLAVSSNTTRIEVFAPGLDEHSLMENDIRYRRHMDYAAAAGTSTATYDSNSSDDSELTQYVSSKHWIHVLEYWQGDRSHNYQIVLESHITNIPNIAFCNADNDSKGRYLASIDIKGNIFVWDIYRGFTVFRTQGDLLDGMLTY